jgi:hypothetical protein
MYETMMSRERGNDELDILRCNGICVNRDWRALGFGLTASFRLVLPRMPGWDPASIRDREDLETASIISEERRCFRYRIGAFLKAT